MKTGLDGGALLAALLLAGCAVAPPLAPPAPQPDATTQPAQREAVEVLARSDDFAVVLPRPGDDYAALARRYLGDGRRAWWIAGFNGAAKPVPGVEVVIPLKARLLNSVEAGGVRTLAVLCYHRFDDGRSKLSVSARDFAQQMDYLARNGYNVIALKDVPAILRGELPMPPKAVAITIDDGYRSTYEVAFPILARHGFPATVFLYTDFAGLPAAMNWAQMKEMSASGLIDIQPHSKTHSNLTLRQDGESDRAYAERLKQEIDVATSQIERRLGQSIHSFAYPYGDANETVTELVSKRGIAVAFTVSPGGNPFYAYPLMLRRTMIFGDDSPGDFANKLAVVDRNGAR